MADMPPAESVDDALKRATDAVNALKHAKPATTAEARRRACEVIDAQREMRDAAHRITDAAVAKRFNGTNGHGHANGGGADVLSDGALTALANGLVPFLREAIADATAPLIARLDELEASGPAAKALTSDGEARQPLYDGGTWNVTKVFQPGDVTTYIGTMWVCREKNVDTRPGKSDAWRLMEKSRR